MSALVDRPEERLRRADATDTAPAGATPRWAWLGLVALIVLKWIDRGFGSLGEERLAIAAATLLIVGVQIFFSSFLLSILGLRRTS